MSLISNKKIPKETLTKFNVGYYCNSKYFGNLPQEVINRISRIKDNTLIFPLYREDGVLVSIAYRTQEVKMFYEKTMPKDPGYLYGLNVTYPYILKEGYVLLVEGVFDLLSLYSHGFMNTVANLGTTISPKKLYNLKKYTDNIIVMFDNDFGGKSGESMLKEKAKNFNFNIQVLNLPVDPDDFLLFNGKEQLLCKIQQTKSYFGSLKSSITLNLK